MNILGREIPESWTMIAVDDLDYDPPGWLQDARQEVITMGAIIETQMLSNVHKCLNPTLSNWFTACIPQKEFDYIAELVGNQLECCVEVGLNNGGTHVIMKHMAPLVISVDYSWPHVLCTMSLLRQFNRLNGSELIWGVSSHSSTTRKVQNLSDGIDLLLIDADHSASQAARDFHAYYAMVKSGGWVLFDDFFSTSGVYDAVTGLSDDMDIPMSVAYSEESLQGVAFFQKA